MGTTKSQIFSKRHNDLARIYRALANPARLAILEYIGSQKACICNDIVDEIGLAQPTVSQHLKELKNLGLIEGEIEGNRVCYCLNLKRWNQIQKNLQDFFEQTKMNCC